jgi:hypothetical protein
MRKLHSLRTWRWKTKTQNRLKLHVLSHNFPSLLPFDNVGNYVFKHGRNFNMCFVRHASVQVARVFFSSFIRVLELFNLLPNLLFFQLVHFSQILIRPFLILQDSQLIEQPCVEVTNAVFCRHTEELGSISVAQSSSMITISLRKN